MPTERTGRWPGRVSDAIAKRLPPKVAHYVTARMIIMLASVAGVLVLVFGYLIGRGLLIASMMSGMVQLQTVSTVHARPTLWQTQVRSVGTLHAVQGADLASEIAGLVTRIGFRPGDDVRAGTLLVQLRDDSEKASAEVALQTYKRYAALIKTQAIS
jgi:membrane fusion protein, multidrug efflux system